LIEKRTDWVKQNFVLVLDAVFKLANCKKLQNCCLELICIDPQSSKNFSSLDKDILFYLLERDDLQAEEIDIWNCLIKWGIEQTPGLGSENSDRDKWEQKNFEALKKTLSQFIPLVRFMGISSDDFFDKVHPYKAVIPIHIYEELEEFYYKDILPKIITLPPRIIMMISTIIKPSLAQIIANWIDRNDSNVLSFNNKYRFSLIYKKSRDGFDYTTFHNKCNRQGPFVVLIKLQSKIYGGYNSIGYALRRGRWLVSSDSFIFSFGNDRDTHNMKIGRVINRNLSIWEDCNEYFFNFGNHLYLYGKTLYLSNRSNYDNILNGYHESICLPIEKIEEIEVFSVIKNNSFT